jgi:hypothetical protein
MGDDMSEEIWVHAAPAQMWTLSPDRKQVRIEVPLLSLEGMPEPLRIHLDFDAATADAILDRLTVLRSQMLPEPQRS